MDTFEWEDGTVVERPYVEIDNVKHYLQDGTMSGGTPVSSTNLNEMQSILNNNVSGGFQTKGTVLWANQEPTSDFSARNIMLSDDDYDMLEIFFRTDSATNLIYITKVLKGYSFQMDMFSAVTQAYRWVRRCTYINDLTYSIPDCYLVGDNSTTHNDQLIPLYIIGYKTGFFE